MWALSGKQCAWGLLLVAVHLTSAQDVRVPTKDCRAYCFGNSNSVQMSFFCNMNSDAEGSWFGLDLEEVAVSPSQCQYTFTNNILRINTIVATNPSVQDDNSCGRSISIVNGENTYSWRFLYWEKQTDNIWAGLDRIYSFVCNTTNIIDTKVEASVSASNDLTRVIVPSAPSVTMSVRVRDVTNTFVPLQGGVAVRVGQQIQLELLQVQQGNNDLATCVSGFSCVVSGNGIYGDADDISILDSNGCPTLIGNTRSRVAPETGFIQVTTNPTTSCRARTGAIDVYQIGQSTSHYYQCRVRFCLSEDTSCQNLCDFNTSPGRRRRQASEEGEHERVVTVEIRLNLDQDEKTESGLSESVVIGLSVGVSVVVVLLLVLVMLLVCLLRGGESRRRRSMKDENIRHAYQSGIPPKE